MNGSVIIFGLDGATYTVLDDMVARGVMPFFGQWQTQGVRALLRSTTPPLTPPAWTTLVTGRSPGHHGITNFLQFESPNSRFIRVVSSRNVCSETIWSMVSRQGLRAGSLNFVAHNPAPEFNGYCIPGWITWRWVKSSSRPKELIERLQRDVPGFDVRELAMDFNEEKKAVAGAALENYEPWIDLHIRRDRQWFELLKHQMEHDPCALTGIVFDGVDKLQHLLWHVLDPALRPTSPDAKYARLQQLCDAYFRQIDDFLGETVRLAGDDATVLVVSDHGFTGSTEILYVNSWLEQQGWLAWSRDADVVGEDSHVLGEGQQYHATSIDMSRTLAYADSASSNGIHIPVIGPRGSHGVAPEDYAKFRETLRKRLLNECRDPNTGEPLVTAVWTREEIFDGPCGELAPDLTLQLRDHGFVSVLRGREVLKRRAVPTGTHHPDGVLLAVGPKIRCETPAAIPSVSLLDIAPLALHVLGLEIPRDLEGRAPVELMVDSAVRRRPPRIGAATQAPPHLKKEPQNVPAESPDTAEEVDEQILLRLKALGYME
ncbi:MAG: alkaline phosphatase family protein [Phycisphaerae bacterium]|nr:alkaline phosphatase family protein [Phycisphaerae bacterium]